MRLEDLVEERLKGHLRDTRAVSQGDSAAFRAVASPWSETGISFQRGRLNLTNRAQYSGGSAQSITAEDIQYDRYETKNRFAGTAKVVVDIISFCGDRPANEKDTENKLRFTLRQLNRWTESAADGSRVLNCEAIESSFTALDLITDAYFGTASFTVRFVETEEQIS